MNEEDNIEGFFKNRLEPNQHFEFREEDWTMLEKKLDAAAVVKSSGTLVFKKIKFWLIVLLIMSLTFLLGWFGHERFSQNRELGVEEKTSNNLTEIIAMDVDPNCVAIENENCEVELVDTEPVNAMERKGIKSQFTKPTVGFVVTRYEDSEIPLEPIQNRTLPQDDKNQSALNSTIVDDFHSLVQKNDFGFIEGYKEYIAPYDQTLLLQTQLHEIDNHLEELEDSIRMKDLFKEANAQALDRMLLGSDASKWSIGVTLSPEMNSVGFAQSVKWSGQFGLGVYYRAFKNFTVSTGVGYTKKKYNTQGQNYKPYEGYWIKSTSGVIPDNVDGKCAVIDIPINFGYALNPNKRFYLDGVIGLSNYILLSETYYYEFDELNPEYNDQPISYGWQTKDNSNFLLSVLNVSIGVNWNINDRLVITGSPYFKIPLKEIGYGNIPLHSSGTSFTLRYKFFRKEKQILK